jgi:hypothetical protein
MGYLQFSHRIPICHFKWKLIIFICILLHLMVYMISHYLKILNGITKYLLCDSTDTIKSIKSNLYHELVFLHFT